MAQNEHSNIKRFFAISVALLFSVTILVIVVGLSKETMVLKVLNKNIEYKRSFKESIKGVEYLVQTDKGTFMTSKEIYNILFVSESYDVEVKGVQSPFSRKEISSFTSYY
mgnify:CR=1 FL=1